MNTKYGFMLLTLVIALTGLGGCSNMCVNSKIADQTTIQMGSVPEVTTIQPSFTKLDAYGNDLPDDALIWGMVRDNVTGLIWEVKALSYGSHYWKERYSWEEANTVFIDLLNKEKFCRTDDWRLPTVQELTSLIDRTCFLPAVNQTYFPHTDALDFWSSTPDASDPEKAWRIHFCRGYVSAMSKTHRYFARAVRGPIFPPQAMIINSNGTVSDPNTGLMWQRSPKGPMAWEKANRYCRKLNRAGYRDWRLPAAHELQTLIDYSRSNPAANEKSLRIKPLKDLPPSNDGNPLLKYVPDSRLGFWSQTTYASNPEAAWVVDFKHGSFWHHDRKNEYYVRAVRTEN